MSKVVLITGASSGMGREAAVLLAQKGHRVYAGARRVERMEDLADHGITSVALDVTKEADNERVVSQIIADEGRIDVLINNAGFGLYGPVEKVPLEDARYQFDVNLFGLAHLTQLVLPHMRAQGSGRIVNISSVGGRVFSPMGAWYHATKHALEGWSDCLRIEAKPFGIDVVVVQPGAIRTEFGDVAGAQMTKFRDSEYGAQIEPFLKMMQNQRTMDRATDAKVLAKVFVEAATVEKPRRRYVKGALGRPALLVRRWLGDRVYERILRLALR